MTDAESPARTWQCNQPDCTEKFDTLVQSVIHQLDEHADPPDGRDPYEVFFEEVGDRLGR